MCVRERERDKEETFFKEKEREREIEKEREKERERQWKRETGKDRTRKTDRERCFRLFSIYFTKPGLALHKNNNYRCQNRFCLRRSFLREGKRKRDRQIERYASST